MQHLLEPPIALMVEEAVIPDAAATTPASSPSAADPRIPEKEGFRFWLVIISLLLSTFCAALDITALSTSQPTIAQAVDFGNDFTWMASAYALASCVLAPLHPNLVGPALSFLTNELSDKLPQAFIDTLQDGVPSAFSALTDLKDLPGPLRRQVHVAYDDSFREICYVCIAFGGVGFIASLFMKHYKLHASKDETHALKERREKRNDPEQ